MACPTCDHTMDLIVVGVWWCPRCGTLQTRDIIVSGAHYDAPKIVERAIALCEVVDATHYPSAMPMPVGVYARARNLRECCEIDSTDPGEPIREAIYEREERGSGR